MNSQPAFDDFRQFVFEERLAKLLDQQGPKLEINSLADFGKDIWPEDESIDDFLNWLAKTRREEGGHSFL